MEISIRAALMDDAPALQRLTPESAQALSKGYYTPQQIDSAIRTIFGVDTQLIMELASTMPGEPLYAAMGYQVTKRFDHPMPDGTTLPLATMDKELS